ncbi:MAG: cobyric acid synthase [Halobacteriales archaeon]
MTRTLLVLGTASHVGKSTVVAGLCRFLSDRGVDVAPFKAQNMSNNARVALTPSGDWGEIGVSQYVQARAARVTPSTDMNPVLLKPRGDGESQLILDGQAVEHYASRAYYEEHWTEACDHAEAAYGRLADRHDVIIAEGAGSPAEINLQHRDLANIEAARLTDADVLLLADIERGGAFGSLYGTVELAPEAIRDRLVGMALTKFRGDRDILSDGIAELETLLDVPMVGVLPHADPGLPAEDSVSLPDDAERAVLGQDDLPPEQTVTIVVPRFPRISNFTDLEPLARQPGVRVAYQPLDADLSDADAVVLPGTKNTVNDLLALHEAGFDEVLADFDGPVIGLCGGYQMLGRRITNASIEGTGDREVVEGLGRLPVETRFSEDKQVERVTRTLQGVGPLAGASGSVTGYEIHMGETHGTASADRPIGPNSEAKGNVLGTYLHGLFENRTAREAFVAATFRHAGKTAPTASEDPTSPYDRAAALVADHLDLAALGLDPPL